MLLLPLLSSAKIASRPAVLPFKAVTSCKATSLSPLYCVFLLKQYSFLRVASSHFFFNFLIRHLVRAGAENVTENTLQLIH